MYEYAGLTKKQFLEKNSETLNDAISKANTAVANAYPAGVTEITLSDLYVLLNCEAGLQGGIVDPNHIHSEGEHGLFPLPSNISYWIGASAPAWNKPMTLSVNIDSFLLYLAQLKNKVVTVNQGYTLYAGLFEADGISGKHHIQARVLAGVVHGYFYSGTYRNGKRPKIASLLDGYASERGLSEMLDGSGYVHEGSPILSNRSNNIETGLSWL